MEKDITFTAPIKRKCDDGKPIPYKLKFIDSFRFMSASLLDLDNLSSIFYSIECKSCMGRKKIDSEFCFVRLKNNRLIYRYKECKEEWKSFHFIPLHFHFRKFPSIYQFCNGDLNKFILLLRKGVYPYEDMDNWENFDETTIPPKEAFYSKLNVENIGDKNYEHAQKVWEVFGIKNRG